VRRATWQAGLMPDHLSQDPAPRSRVGLCELCEHRQLVRNTRGSTFWLCRLSREDPSFPRYPRLPVLSCAGFRRAGEEQRPRG